jgi:hypothetical protein
MSQGICSDPAGLECCTKNQRDVVFACSDIDFLALSKKFEALETEHVEQMGTDASAGLIKS